VDIHLPPLRERKQDIPGLASYFFTSHSRLLKCNPRPASSRLIEVLQRYSWPGNIRQLENLIRRHVIFGDEEAIYRELAAGPVSSAGLSEPEVSSAGSISLKRITQQAVLEVERKVILKTLEAHRWNRKRAARALNISYRALLYKIQHAGLSSRATVNNPKAMASPTAGA